MILAVAMLELVAAAAWARGVPACAGQAPLQFCFLLGLVKHDVGRWSPGPQLGLHVAPRGLHMT